jgi:hypothetical protein
MRTIFKGWSEPSLGLPQGWQGPCFLETVAEDSNDFILLHLIANPLGGQLKKGYAHEKSAGMHISFGLPTPAKTEQGPIQDSFPLRGAFFVGTGS